MTSTIGRSAIRVALPWGVLAFAAALASPVSAQSPALLAITSPSNGAVVSAGSTVTITVTSPAGASFTTVSVIANGPIEMSDEATSLPAQFSLTIPAEISAREYVLTARGRTTAGDFASAAIRVHIERDDAPYAISSQVSQLQFDGPGDETTLVIVGDYGDGSSADVTESANMVYSSSNPNVATVSALGAVKAIAPGRATINVSYGPPENWIRASIPVRVPPPPFSLAPAAIDFGQQNVGVPATQQVVLTNSSAGKLSIVGVAAAGEYASSDTCVAASPLDPAATCTITLTFTPFAAGPRPGTLTITTSRNVVPLAIPIAGTGVSP